MTLTIKNHISESDTNIISGHSLKVFVTKVSISISIVVLTALIYWQLRLHGTINADDFHLTTNKFFAASKAEMHTYSYQGLTEGMTTIIAGIWMPLMYMSVGAEMEFFGTDFGPYHLVAAGIHAAGAIILFLLLFQMTQALWKSALAAVLFAVHPLNVEPVSWLVCIRVVQSGFFCLLAIYFYTLYTARNSSVHYTLSLFWYAASLFSIPMFPAVPFLLLLLDFWPLDRLGKRENDTSLGNLSLPRIRRAVWEKFPFFGIMIVVLAILGISHDLSMSVGLDRYPLHERILNIFLIYVGYFQQILLPLNLAVYYPFPESFPVWKTAGAILIVGMITMVSLSAVRRYPFLIVGWLWFAGMMFPLSGIAQIGTQSRADHYAYIPLIGLLIFLCWGAASAAGRLRLPRIMLVLISIIIVIAPLTFLSWRQAGYWKDSIALMTHALKVTRNNFEAHNYLAQALADQGDLAAAVDHFQQALAIKPDHLKSHINIANIYVLTGLTDKAIYHLTRALEINPKDERVLNNLGALYVKAHDLGKAMALYRQAIAMNPKYAVAYDNLAALEADTGDLDGAIAHFRQALAINPQSAETHFRLAATLYQAGRRAQAADHLRQAIAIDPANPQYRELMAVIGRDEPASTGRPGS